MSAPIAPPRTAVSLLVLVAAGSFGLVAAIRAQAEPPATVMLAGRVVNLRGEGMPAAEVWVGARAPDGRTWRTRTDGEGLYRLRVPRDGAWRIHARADGCCCIARFLFDPFEPQLLAVHEAATLRGVLTNRSNRPVAGASVFAQAAVRPSEAIATATTDEQGRFAIAGVPLGPNRLAAWIDGEGLATAELRVTGDAEVQLAPPDRTTSLTVVLRGLSDTQREQVTLTLTGNVGSGGYHGEPEYPAPFFVRDVPRDGWRIEHLPDWEWIVVPYAPGVRFRPSVVTVASGRGPHAIELVARSPTPSPTTFRAVVRDAGGAAFAGLHVGFYGTSFSPRIDATSDADGQLTIASPWAVDDAAVYSLDDHWRLRLRSAEGQPGRRVRIEAGETGGIEIEAIAACALTGRVLRPDGRPAALARVQLERFPPDRPSQTEKVGDTWTDADGAFELLELADDERLRLVVTGTDGVLVRDETGPLAPGAARPLGEVHLAPGAVVEGIVRTPDDALAVGAVVELRDGNLGLIAGLANATVVTDARGRFRFVGVPVGTARLMVRPRTRGPLRPEPAFDVETGSTHTFALVERMP